MKGQLLLNRYKTQILKMPKKINIGGITFEMGGGSASSLDAYINNFRECNVLYYAPGKSLEASKKLGFYQFNVFFKWKNNALRATKVKVGL